MNFCAIGPLAARNLFEAHSHHMALAQYLYDEDYFNFFQEMLAGGKFVVLDSGVYEGSAVGRRQLMYWMEKLQPSAVILPDVPHDCEKTLKASLDFYDFMNVTGVNEHTQAWKVIHAATADLTRFTSSYITDSRIFDGVCFSRLTGDYGLSINSDRVSQRVDFIQHLLKEGVWQPEIYHHCLGMLEGAVGELPHLAKLGVNSIDSSAPIWRGLHGHALYTGMEQSPVGPLDPFANRDPYWNEAKAEYNFKTCCERAGHVDPTLPLPETDEILF